jgi:RNA polymerase sigma-70 factor, ECF subfamily
MQAREAHTASEPGPDTPQTRVREMDEVLSRCLQSFHRQAYRYVGNVADAEDAVQDALAAAFKHLDQFRGQARMSTWLTTIVVNSARMQLRRRSRYTHLSLDEKFGNEEQYSVSEQLSDCAPSPEDECERSELHGHVLQFVAQLSPPLRKTFQLRDLDGLSTKETANVLGLPDGTVKAQLARARARLRRLMQRARGPKPHARQTCTAPLSVAKK